MTRVDLKDEIIDALELNGGQMVERELFDYLSDREAYKPENPLSDLLHDMRMTIAGLLSDSVIATGPSARKLGNSTIYSPNENNIIKLLVAKVKRADVSTPQEMKRYLEDTYNRLKNTEYLYKYTSIDRAASIIKNKQWYVAHPSTMNDQFEMDRFSDWTGKYFASFVREGTDAESIAMWSMYGQSWEKGVQIGIPVKAFKEWIRGIKAVYDLTGNIIKQPNRVYFGSVLYFDEHNPLGKPGEKISGFKPYSHQQMAGYVKDVAWEYEKEVRLHVDIPSYSANGVLIDIPIDVINVMSIKAGPRYNGDLIQDLSDKAGFLIPNGKSKFTDKLSWTYCDDCEYKKPRRIEV